MELEEAKKILLNCYAMRTKHELDDENKALKQAIEVVLKEIEYLKKNQKYKKDFNGEKIFCLEYDKETLRDMVLEKQEEIKELKSNSIPKDKIREIIEELGSEEKALRKDFEKHRVQLFELYKKVVLIEGYKKLLEEEE